MKITKMEYRGFVEHFGRPNLPDATSADWLINYNGKSYILCIQNDDYFMPDSQADNRLFRHALEENESYDESEAFLKMLKLLTDSLVA